MHLVLERMIKTGSVEAADGTVRKVHSTISYASGIFLQELIRELKPKNSLEVGLGYGASALFICEALGPNTGSRHVAIDPYQYAPDFLGKTFEGIGMLNLERAGHAGMVEFLSLPSSQALPQLVAQGRKFEFAFIDGWHTFDHALVDFFYIDQLLEIGGIVCFDDANWPSLRKVCRYIAANRAYTVYKTHEPEEMSLKRRALQGLVRFLRPFKQQLRFLKSEILAPDSGLGLSGLCIAFRKHADDRRHWAAHNEF